VAPATTSQTYIIINPISGPARRGEAGHRARVAASALEHCGIAGTVLVTRRAGHAYELALSAVAAGAELVIAWGGDGTINEVGRALASTSTSLGIIPGGSGNGLARELGIPFNPQLAVAHAVNTQDWPIDVGDIGGHLFFNIAGIGLDAHVAGRVATRVHHRGLLPYLTASARDLLIYRPMAYCIEANGAVFETTAMVVAIANSRQYGFGACVAPTADLDDGLLDVVVIEDRKLIGNVWRLPSLFARALHRQAGVRVVKVREVRIRSRSAMLFHVDGEPVQGNGELAVRVRPAALRVRARRLNGV
jgi:diacylglycerol kinase (ATP)